jgi:hypothetical protein
VPGVVCFVLAWPWRWRFQEVVGSGPEAMATVLQAKERLVTSAIKRA